jgi:hypothetical protein
MPDFHVAFRDLLHALNLRHGTHTFTSLPEGRNAENFFALKNPTASAGFEPANLSSKGQHATSRPPEPLKQPLVLGNLYPNRNNKPTDGYYMFLLAMENSLDGRLCHIQLFISMCICSFITQGTTLTKNSIRCRIQFILNLFYKFSTAINMSLTEVISEPKGKDFS